MAYNHLQLNIENHISRVRLHRPPVNALNKEMVAELIDAAQSMKANDDVWLVVVTASGKTFCAGADLKERAEIPQEEVINVVSGIQSVVAAWCEVPQPVVMGVQGAALGGGMEFALAGDIIAASENAIFGLPETSLGIIPAAGGTQRLAQRTSSGTAKKWVLTAKKYFASEALSDGVIDYCFSEELFSDGLEVIVSEISSNAPLALRQAKKAIESSYSRWLLDGFENEKSFYQPLIPTVDRTEALHAFREKRKPVWKGK